MKVSERALVARVNRVLKREEQKLRTARGLWYSSGGCQHWQENPDLGRYYRINTDRNVVIDTHVDLEVLGRELGVLGRWEQLSTETS
jgi:hypothetical protein